MGRKTVIAGNWKMFKTQSEASEFVKALQGEVEGYQEVDVVVCPTYTSLSAVKKLLQDSVIQMGAQDVYWEEEGAYTGQISTEMLLDCGCRYVILGHSERRQYFGETDESVNKKLRKVLETALIPILCVGETLEERESGRVSEVVLGQLNRAMDGLTEDDVSRIIIAYEPVWAIGTGRTATPEVAEEVHSMIRQRLGDSFSEKLSSETRILYGGSVKPDNVVELMAQPDLDGALVGGASLNAQTFAKLVKF